MPPDDTRQTLGEMVSGLARNMVTLDPGPLARLRRMDPDGPGEGDFWRLAVQHNLPTDNRGLMFVRLLALLTPKGDPEGSKKLHDRSKPFGEALCQAGYPEKRLLNFLALPIEKRADALERMARWLAAKGHNGVNCIDIYLLLSGDVGTARRLAESYYRAFDKRQSESKEEEAA